MRIALLTNILSPYRKSFFDELYSELVERNIEFKVFVMANSEKNRTWEYNEFKACYTELLAYKTINISNFQIHLNRNFKKRLLEFRPDILISSGSYLLPAVLTSIKLRSSLRYKLLFWSESHLDEERGYNRLIYALRHCLRMCIYQRFDGFWYAGEKSLEFIKRYCSSESVFHFVPNLINQKDFYKANDLRRDKTNLRISRGIPEDRFVLICPARLSHVKGLLPFLRLFSQCKTKFTTTLLIAGDGELRDELQSFIDSHDLDVRLLGHQSQDEMIRLYALADAFLLPSLSDANPLSCIEAIWAGLPLFVSRHVGNYPEIVRQGENGYVFSYQNPDEAIALLDTLASSDSKWLANASKVSLSVATSIYNSEVAVKHLVESMIKDLRGERQ